MLKILWIISLLVVSNQVYAKSKCELEWNALKTVQSQLRHKSSEYLRKKEHQKHNKYQNCRKGRKKKSKSYKTITTYKKQTKTYKKYYSNQYARNSFSNSPVKMKSKFKGEKQDAWIQYYKTPKECFKPESISKFSKCVDYRNDKAKEFDAAWKNK